MAERSRRLCRWHLLVSETLFFIAIGPGTARAEELMEDDDGDSFPQVRDDRIFAPSAILGAQAAAELVDEVTPLILMVSVNGMDRGLEQFALMNGELWATRDTLRRIGIAIGEGDDELLSLNRLPGIAVTYNSREQRLDLMVQPELLALPEARRNVEETEIAVEQTSEGLIINYDATAFITENVNSFSAFTELRYFSGNAVFDTTGIYRTSNADFTWREGYIRLDTSFAYSIPESRITARIGDSLTVPSRWTRTTRMGGIQIGTNNNLQPYLQTAPLPSFIGSATLPSKVDLYINGVRRYNGELPSGPFEIGSGPTVIDGSGQAQVVLTDISGRVTTLDYQIYDTPLLLRQGHTDWSAEAGFVREEYAIESFEYGEDPFFSGDLRYGLTNQLTIEAHGEASNNFVNSGVGAAFLLGTYGVVSGSASASRADGRTGHSWELGYSWIDGTFRFAAEVMRASADYADLAERAGARYPIQRDVVHAGYYDRLFGTFGVSYVSQQYPRERAYRYLNLSWQKPIDRNWWVSVRGQKQFDREQENSLFLTLSYTPGPRDSFRASADIYEDSTFVNLNARRSIPLEGGVGWNVDAFSDDGEIGGAAQLDYLNRYGEANAGISSRRGREAGYLGYRGSLVLMDGGVFPARRIYDGFALVTTEGYEGVPVLVHNREVGKTNGDGQLLVTGLNAYQHNKVSIDTTNLPPEAEVGAIVKEAVPADRAGASVSFPIRPLRSMLVTLVDTSGAAIPVGTRVTYLDGSGYPMLTGYDGQLYIEDAIPGAVLMVDAPSGPCRATLPSALPTDRAGRTGELLCTAN